MEGVESGLERNTQQLGEEYTAAWRGVYGSLERGIQLLGGGFKWLRKEYTAACRGVYSSSKENTLNRSELEG